MAYLTDVLERIVSGRTKALAGCGKTPERLLFPEFLAADAG
jgi:hypothetical protein